MVSGFNTSPYDHDKMVLGEAKLIRSAVRPLVSTGILLTQEDYGLRLSLHRAPNGDRLVRETNKGKRFESFLSSACDIELSFFVYNALIICRIGGRVKHF